MGEELVRMENVVKTFPGPGAVQCPFDLVSGEVHALMARTAPASPP